MALIKQFSVQLLASLTILNFMGQTESLLITDFVDKIEHIREMKVSQLSKHQEYRWLHGFLFYFFEHI